MIAFLKDGRTIIGMGLAFVALTLGFGVWIQQYDLQILDEMSDVEQIRSLLASMTPEQKSAHWWMTLALDYFYPIAYGGFFAGLALRYLGGAGLWLALPAAICAPADMIENTIQLFLLSGDESLIGVKPIITPIKLVTFLAAAMIALVALGVGVYQRLIKRNED